MKITGESYTQAMRHLLEAARAAVPGIEPKAELLDPADVAAEAAGPAQRWQGWGPWDIDREQCTLWTEAPGVRYQVELHECGSSNGALFWVAQIAHKTWGRTPADQYATRAGFVVALDDLLDLQDNLCRDDRKLSADEIRRLVQEGDLADGYRDGHCGQSTRATC